MDRKRIRKQVKEAFSVFSPRKIIAKEHLSRQDVVEVKRKIVSKMSPINIILSTIFLVANICLFTIMTITTKGKLVEVYGVASLAGQIVGMVGSFITAFIIAISYYPKEENTAINLRRLAGDLFYITITVEMMLCIYTDAEKGYTTASTALSPSVILFVIIMLIQPAFWIDAFILDTFAVIGIIGVSLYCSLNLGMQAFPYYVAVAFALAVSSYIIVCILFYAETQRYCQYLQTERIHNVAIYDELTKCKNRNALKEYLNKNKKGWENRQINLLLVMFDIDNFKEYNDQFSHLGGDYCLKIVTESVRYEFKAPNLEFYRWGGEEFLLFFELKNESEAIPILRRVLNSVRNSNVKSPSGAPKEMVTISVGGHLITQREIFVFNKELAIVDEYLYKAKAAGKDVICYNGKILLDDNNVTYVKNKENEA